MNNFLFPFFARDIAEFWRRWHISLTTWFRDYVYIPLGGSRQGKKKAILNVFIVFIVSGFWHGASWNFIVWGILNALFFLPLLVLERNRKYTIDNVASKGYPSVKELLQIAFTFSQVAFAFIAFRANDLSHMYSFVRDIVLGLTSKKAYVQALDIIYWKMWYEDSFELPVILFVFVVIEWTGRENEFGLQSTGQRWPLFIRWILYYAICICIYFYSFDQQQFIYFQF